MIYRLFTFLAIVVLSIGSQALPAHAQTNAGDGEAAVRQMLQARDQEIKEILGGQEEFTDAQLEELKTQINGLIDFRAMSELVLGSAWDDLSAPQQREFVDVFSKIVRSHSLSNMAVYRSDVSITSIDVVGDSAYVVSKTIYQDTPVDVEYTLGYQPDGGWRIHDIILDEVSTAEGYARSFRTVIRQRGFDTLMNSLRNKLARM